MRIKNKIFWFVFFFVLMLRAQQNNPSIRWQTISTPHFRILFPAENKSLARKTAVFLEQTYRPVGKRLGIRAAKTTLILNTRNSISNAYAALAPRRMEWNMSPMPSMIFGPVPWQQILSLHEFSHISQIDTGNRGVIRLASLGFGQIGELAGLFWAYPFWYFEGDAVYSETVLSRGGRGRSAFFYNPVRMIASDYPSKKQDYYRFYYRSYKTYYPTHYELGYFLNAYIHRHYPDSVFTRIATITPYLAFLPGAMHIVTNRETGLDYRQLTRKMLSEVRRLYPPLENDTVRPFFKRKSKAYTRDLYPVASGDTLWFLRYGFDDAPAVWQYVKGKSAEKKVEIPDYRYDKRGNLLAWTEFKPHPRWTNEIYRRIRIYNIKTGKSYYLTRRGNWQWPVFSPDGKSIAAVFYDTDMEASLKIISLKDLKITDSVRLTGFFNVIHPFWYPDARKILFVAAVPGKSAGIFNWHIPTGRIDTLMPPHYGEIIQYPQYVKGKIIYQSGKSDVQIVRYDPETGKETVLTRERYAALTPYVDAQGRLWYAGYSVKGREIKCKALNTVAKSPSSRLVSPWYVNPSDTLHPVSMPAGTKNYPVKRFNHLRSYFNPHSWFFFGMPTGTDGVLTANVWMNDVLNESAFNVGVLADVRKQWTGFAAWEWRRYFPVLGFQGQYTGWLDSHTRQAVFQTYVKVPLDLSHGIWSEFFDSKTSWQWEQSSFGIRRTAGQELAFSVFRQRAYRDPESRFGWRWRAGFFKDWQHGDSRFSAMTAVHLPGFFKHDVWKISGALLRQNGRFIPLNPVIPVEGYPVRSMGNINRFSLWWHTPLAYPDWGLRRLFNLKRVRLKLFYETAFSAGYGQYTSFGGQLVGDWNVFGLLPEFPMGVELAYVKPLETFRVSVVLFGLRF